MRTNVVRGKFKSFVDTIILLLWDFVLLLLMLCVCIVLLENSLSHDQLKLHIWKSVQQEYTTREAFWSLMVLVLLKDLCSILLSVENSLQRRRIHSNLSPFFLFLSRKIICLKHALLSMVKRERERKRMKCSAFLIVIKNYRIFGGRKMRMGAGIKL